MAGGESKDPAAVRDAMLEEAARISREGLDDGLFRRLKKAAYGSYVRALNSFENLCVEQAQGYFMDQDPWTFPERYDEMTKESVEEFLGAWVKEEYTALTVIRPLEAAS